MLRRVIVTGIRPDRARPDGKGRREGKKRRKFDNRVRIPAERYEPSTAETCQAC